MAFLRNRTVNLINLHYGIQALAQGMGGAFYLVFLLKGGLSASFVLCTMMLILIGRFCMRPVVLVVGKKWGLKPALIIGSLVLAAQYPILSYVHGIGNDACRAHPRLVARRYILLVVLSRVFASLGDSEHRGHQVGAREALAATVGIIAPLIGAWMIVTTGPHIAFASVGFVQALAAIPLLGTPNVAVLRDAPGAFRAALPGILLFMADGWFAASFVFVWQIALFFSLRESYQAYGGAMALAALVGAASGLLLGRHIDAGHGGRAVLIAYGIAALTLAGAIGQRRYTLAGNRCQCVRLTVRLRAGACDDGGRLQPRQSIALCTAVSYCSGRRLGCGRSVRLPDRLRARGLWLAFVRHSHAGISGPCDIGGAAAALLCGAPYRDRAGRYHTARHKPALAFMPRAMCRMLHAPVRAGRVRGNSARSVARQQNVRAFRRSPHPPW